MGRAMPYADHVARTEDDGKVPPRRGKAVYYQGVCQDSVISRLVEVRRKQFVTVHADWERGSRQACESTWNSNAHVPDLPTSACKDSDAKEDQGFLERVIKPFGDVLTHF